MNCNINIETIIQNPIYIYLTKQFQKNPNDPVNFKVIIDEFGYEKFREFTLLYTRIESNNENPFLKLSCDDQTHSFYYYFSDKNPEKFLIENREKLDSIFQIIVSFLNKHKHYTWCKINDLYVEIIDNNHNLQINQSEINTAIRLIKTYPCTYYSAIDNHKITKIEIEKWNQEKIYFQKNN